MILKQNTNSLKLGMAILLLVALPWKERIYAQVEASVDISTSYDDNVFLSTSPQPDFITDAEITLLVHPKDSAISYYANSNYFAYLDNSDRNLFMNKLGFSYYKALDTSKSNFLFLGGSWLNRLNKQEFNYYNYDQFNGYTNLQFKIKKVQLKTGYNFRYRNFSYMPELNNFQNYLFFNMNRSFETRTTFIVESNLGLKTFKGEDYYVEVSGKGMNGNPHTVTVEGDNINMSHLIMIGRVAQSLHDRVGIYVQYKRQISLIDKGSYINSDVFYQDEELFDDPFSYENSEFSTRLTVILPKQVSLQTGGIFSNKKYLSEQAYESSTDTLGVGGIREDTKNSFYVKLEKTFNAKDKWYNALRIYSNYNLVANKSNSYWYNYNYNIVTFGLQLNF
ncbi:MAG: hypothetical protein K9H64_19790 [Bacteroidales bacterium]|nr:hypothetical protein [Bacteroidales bacterium]MCF8458295.1 hypothetical protein [Bacteroidales bacterium]